MAIASAAEPARRVATREPVAIASAAERARRVAAREPLTLPAAQPGILPRM
ncbi:hypothetical protein L843_4253 [Mycobacterium intracellulare MIN_061107_1834]|nr:hypothetical protein L843_4253 [Mycobacterium intracellulare MIN_061107_1834]